MCRVTRRWVCCADELIFCLEGKEQLLEKSFEVTKSMCLKKFTCQVRRLEESRLSGDEDLTLAPIVSLDTNR